MKINDIIYQYKSRSFSGNDGICRLRTFVNSKNQIIIILTELNNNTSASITNSIETIYEQLVNKGLITSEATIIEHDEGSEYSRESFDRVKVIDNDSNKTTWQRMTKESVVKLIESSEFEFDQNSEDRCRIIDEAEKVSLVIDPKRNIVFQESPEYIVRALDIKAKQISKKSLEDLVSARANERLLQQQIKLDLSILAEIYAHPNDQYICFSEFPVENGFIDFVILTGISRMDVFIIEIKGADFNLVNKDSYQKISSKMDTALSQIRQRIGYIYRNLGDFRKQIHSIRESVESGNQKYNSLLGPRGKLQVDPQKDINLHPVIIGGLTVNDSVESKIRHDIENTSTPRIRVESWNTWLRKLRRK